MYHQAVNLLRVVICGLCLSASVISAAETRYQAMHTTLDTLEIDTTTIREVEGVLIEHGLISIVLESGTAALMKPVNGRVIGAVFSGKGIITFQPNNTTERVNLDRFYNAEVLTESITSAVFMANDDVLTSALEGLPAASGKAAELEKLARKLWPEMVLNDDVEFDNTLARTLLNDYRHNQFMTLLQREPVGTRLSKDPEFKAYATYDPYDVEPYKLYIFTLKDKISTPTHVNQCPPIDGTRVITDDGIDEGDLINVMQHTMDMQLNRSLEMTVRDRIDCRVLADSVLVFDLMLYPTLTIDSIKLIAGDDVTFFRAKEHFYAWVELPRVYRRDEKFSLEVYYRGQVFTRVGDYTILQTSFLWQPSHSYSHKAFFDVTYHYPESMTLASVGARSTFETKDRITTARWVSGRPVTNFSFHIGFFKRRDIPSTASNIPKAAILYKTGDQLDAVENDMRQSLEFYTKLFGPLPIDSLIGTELPGSHGEAFPGMLHLSTLAFYLSGDAGTDDFFGEQFTSHEVAHQWWGIGVQFATYRDHWLSEGFAMYSCLMYSQLAAAEGDKFFRLLEEYRKELLEFGKKSIGKNLAPPAIAIGARASSGASSGAAHNLFVYYKPAWVLHMLRNMMLDLQTMKEDAFVAVMRQFYAKYKGRRASTEDFINTIHEVTGTDVTWFFDQWVYGNKIPTYTHAWKKDKTADGRWLTTLRVKQSGVPPSFQMIIPLKVVYTDGSFERLRMVMKGAELIVELPASTKEPDELVFNDLSSVLCDAEEEDF